MSAGDAPEEAVRLLTADQVAEILQISKARVYDNARSGIIPSVRIGRLIRFSEKALDDWIARGGTPLADNEQALAATALNVATPTKGR